MCFAATAAHCFFDGDSQSDLTRRSGPAAIRTGDLGRINATFYVNPDFVGTNSETRTRDTALIAWRCTGKEKAIPPLKIVPRRLRAMDQVEYGKVMLRTGGTPGLYRGEVRRPHGDAPIGGEDPGTSTDAIHQFGDKIELGDSGGPLLCPDADGRSLCGVLSTQTIGGHGYSHYATNQSLVFLINKMNELKSQLAWQGSFPRD